MQGLRNCTSVQSGAPRQGQTGVESYQKQSGGPLSVFNLQASVCNFTQLRYHGSDSQNDVSNCLGLFGIIHPELLWKKTPLGVASLELAGVSTRSGMGTSGRCSPLPHTILSQPFPLHSCAQRQDSQPLASPSLLPWEQSWSHSSLPWHWLRAKSQPEVHQHSRGMAWSHSPETRFVLQVSQNFGKSTGKVWIASEPDPLRIPSPGPAEMSFIAVWPGACWHPQPFSPAVASDRAFTCPWQIHNDTAPGSWCAFLSTFSGPVDCFCNQVSSDGEGDIPLAPLGIIPRISHGHTSCGLGTPYIFFLFYSPKLWWVLSALLSFVLLPYLYSPLFTSWCDPTLAWREQLLF